MVHLVREQTGWTRWSVSRAHVELQIRRLSDELGLRPAPGLANLRELVEQFRADGL